jgi:hypothetical protein
MGGCGGNDNEKDDQEKDCWRDPSYKSHKIVSFSNLLSPKTTCLPQGDYSERLK